MVDVIVDDRPAPVDDMRQMTFTIKLDSYGKGDERHQEQIVKFLWTLLNRGFGADRCQVWCDGKRIFFDPLAVDSDQILA